MKNQYVGDVGDYGKYSLLRAFADAGVEIGVNWYLTENDGSNDGNFTTYLQDDGMRKYQPGIFDVLKAVARKKDKSVLDIQKRGILPGAVFYDKQIDVTGTPKERIRKREQWFERSVDVLKDAGLIFMDPDNGLMETGEASKKGAEKYILPEEVERYFSDGHDVVYYCHKGRRTYGAWGDYLTLMFDRIPEAKPAVLTFHKGSQRSYVFLIHEKNYVKYRKIIDGLKRNWDRIFTEDYTNRGDTAGETHGGITLERSDGVTMTLSRRADGQLEVRLSNDPNTSVVLTADVMCRLLGIR